MKAIGGFLELELPREDGEYHRVMHTYKSGRAAFNALLTHLKPSKVFVPYYCCDSLLEPLVQGGLRHEFYPIDQAFETVELPELAPSELFLYVNYFDLKRDFTRRLVERYGRRLIVDATQSFYLKGDGRSWLFNSCRKFFGVPDGAYLYSPVSSDDALPVPAQANTDYRLDHLIYRANGDLKRAYPLSLENEARIDTLLTAMSDVTRVLLNHVNYTQAAETRRRNYQHLHARLGHLNTLHLGDELGDAVPHYFPLLPTKPIARERFWEREIYMPYLWKECLERSAAGFGQEKQLAAQLLPLPIDQRYTQADMDRVADAVLEISAAT